MTNRYPLILDTSDGNKIKELPAGDNLYLRNNNIVDVLNIEALGVINAADVRVNGAKVVPQALLDLTDTPSTYSGQANKLLKVSSDETTLDFVSISDIGNITAGDIELTGDIFPETDGTSDVGTATNKFANVRATDLQGNLRANDGTLIFNATSKQIPYSVIVGGPTSLSEFLNDSGYTTIAQVSAYIESTLTRSDFKGSFFGDDSTLIIDGTTSTINASTISGTFGGPVATSQITTDTINSGSTLLIRTAGTVFGETINIQPAGGNTNVNLNATNINLNGTITSTLITNNNATIGGNLGVSGNLTVNGTTNITGIVSVSGTIDGDFVGSVFADDSTLIIDGNTGKIVSPIITGTATFENNIIIQGNLTVNGTTTSVSTTNTTITDNIITLNEGEIGAGVTAGSSGIEIDRGSESSVSFVWDEGLDKWSVGSQNIVAGTFEGGLIGNVTGNTTGIHTGSVIGNVIGNLTGDVIGSIFAEDSSTMIDATEGKIVGPIASTSWTADSYTNITVNGFLEIEPQFLQINSQADGYMQLNAGDGTTIGGGYVQVNAGDGGSSTSGFGGYVQINAGDGTGSNIGSGGYIQIEAGRGSGLGSQGGGYISISAGNAGGGNLSGGYTSISAGNSSGNALGAYTQIRAGSAEDATGGEVRIYGGASTNANGGDVVIEGGLSTNGSKGRVIIDKAAINGDLVGSVFADDSTVIIDGLDGSVYAQKLRTSESSIALGFNSGLTNQGTTSIAIGSYAGQDDQDVNSIAIGGFAGSVSQNVSSIAIGGFAGRSNQGSVAISIGQFAGFDTQGDRSIAIGAYAGQNNQNVDSIAIGNYAGQNDQPANTVIINATGAPLNGSEQNGFYVKPIRPGPGTSFLQYNSISGEITQNEFVDIKGSVFADDSTLMVDAINNEIFANIIVTSRVENTSTLTLFSDADIIMNASTSAYLQSYNGNFNIVARNGAVGLSDFNGAGNISISDIDGSINLGTTGTIIIQGAASSPINIGVGTSGTVTLGHGGNNIVFNGTVDFSSALVAGLNITGDVKGSVFADDSSPMVDAINFTMFTNVMNLTPLAAPPTAIEGMLVVANGTTWDPDSKGGAVSYPVYYDGNAWNALY